MKPRRETLTDILRAKDMRAIELADRLRVKKAWMSQLLNGTRDASEDVIRKLCRGIGIPFERGRRAYWQTVKAQSLRRARRAEKQLRMSRSG